MANRLEIQRFYDRKGRKVVSRERVSGLDAVPAALRSPYARAQSWIRKFRNNRDEQKFLDLCCGDGRHSVFPAKNGYQVYAVDVSADSVLAAKQLAELNNVANKIEFNVGDATEKMFLTAPYDVIFISGALYYFDLQVFAPQIVSSLNPEGHFICVETNGDNGMMNVIRQIRTDRDSRTKSQLIRKSQMGVLKDNFEVVELKYFDCFTQALRFLPKPFVQILMPTFSHIDNIVLNKLRMNWMAFKFIFVGKKRSL